MDKQTYTVEESARILGIGRNTAYEAVKTGQLPAIRVGKRVLVSRRALENLLSAGARPEKQVVA